MCVLSLALCKARTSSRLFTKTEAQLIVKEVAEHNLVLHSTFPLLGIAGYVFREGAHIVDDQEEGSR